MRTRGFTLIEVVITAGLFAVIGIGFYQVYTSILTTTNILRIKNMALFIANSQIELVRNAAYDDVGVTGGLPNGIFDQYATVTMNGVNFQVERIIRSIDEPFDGTIDGLPQDLSPADNKLVEITVACSSCKGFNPVALVARVAPKYLETASTNGAMRISVFDAVGLPVQGARVQINNDNEDPPISFVDTTNAAGELLIVDAPPGVETYQISVSKDGFSSERTYTAGEDGVLNPVKLNLTVATGTVAAGSFAIDLVSNLSVSSVSPACVAVPYLSFGLTGSKLLSNDPDLLKYDNNHETNGAGLLSIQAIEWDTYTVTSNDETYTITGMNPLNPLSVDPGQNEDLLLVAETSNPYMVTVTVLDDDTSLPIADASVQITGPSNYDETLITDVGVQAQTSWASGGGQDDFVNPARFYDQTNTDYLSTPGQLQLAEAGGGYVSSGSLTSSSFDMGDNGVLRSFTWEPLSQVAGENSLRFQVATNNDNVTWNYIGPDGTSGSYYTATNRTLHSSHAGDRYLRYRAYLTTSDTNFTPILSDTFLTFTSDCIPPGQVTFLGMPSLGTYDVTASTTGYMLATTTISVTDDWQGVTLTMTPE